MALPSGFADPLLQPGSQPHVLIDQVSVTLLLRRELVDHHLLVHDILEFGRAVVGVDAEVLDDEDLPIPLRFQHESVVVAEKSTHARVEHLVLVAERVGGGEHDFAISLLAAPAGAVATSRSGCGLVYRAGGQPATMPVAAFRSRGTPPGGEHPPAGPATWGEQDGD